MNDKARAKRLLVHYMEVNWQNVDLTLDSDNIDELESMIDCIVEAAVSEAVDRMFKELTTIGA